VSDFEDLIPFVEERCEAMKKHFAAGLFSLVITAGTLVAGDLLPADPSGGGDTIQPIPPMSDGDPSGLQAGPGVAGAVAVPEPSTVSLLATSAILGSWFCLRRRRR